LEDLSEDSPSSPIAFEFKERKTPKNLQLWEDKYCAQPSVGELSPISAESPVLEGSVLRAGLRSSPAQECKIPGSAVVDILYAIHASR